MLLCAGPRGARDLFLALFSGVTPGGLRGPDGVSGIELRSAMYEVGALLFPLALLFGASCTRRCSFTPADGLEVAPSLGSLR